jgi:DNA-binding HxlR family transcriptional regulator
MGSRWAVVILWHEGREEMGSRWAVVILWHEGREEEWVKDCLLEHKR